MKIEQLTITPAMAKELLTRNNSNRRYRPRWANVLKARMDRGEWRLTHQAIALAKDGSLKDGQHRLHAIILYGKPVEMMLARDVPDDTFGVLDQGLRRTVADYFGTKKELTQPASFLARLTFGPSVSIQQIDTVHKALGDAPAIVSTISGTRRRGLTSAPVRAAAVMQIVRGEDREYVCNLYRMVVAFDTANPAMPLIAHSFVRQATGAVARPAAKVHEAFDLFVRALFVFDRSKAGLSTIVLKEPDIYLAEVRRDVIELVGALEDGKE
jgi:hypothetical protein